ncbi:glycosyltransferase 87 family protein, partial [Chloroflexota bacterium]
MNNWRTSLNLVILVLLAIMALVGLTWANNRYIAQDAGMNDFLPRWAGTRWLMIEGRSPYGAQTTEDIQELAYGRPARSSEDKGEFLYPLYAALIYAPFSLIADPVLARALWMTLLEVALFIAVGGSLALTRWRPPAWILVLLILLMLIWYHSVVPILNGDYVVLCLLFIVLAFLAIRSNQEVMAGFLLALAGVRIEILLLLFLFIFVWVASQDRWLVLWSYLGHTVLLIAVTSLIIPDWIVQNLRQAYHYYRNIFSVTPGGILIYWLPGVGAQLGWVITVFTGGMLFWEWRAVLRQDFRWFYWVANLTITAANLIGLRTGLENYILLLPGIILVLATWDERWGRL